METTESGGRAGEFAALDTEIVHVGVDARKEQMQHAVNGGSAFPLRSDAGGKLAERLGINNARGMSSRVTDVGDKAGTIREIVPRVKGDRHVDELLAAARTL